MSSDIEHHPRLRRDPLERPENQHRLFEAEPQGPRKDGSTRDAQFGPWATFVRQSGTSGGRIPGKADLGARPRAGLRVAR